MMVLLLVRYASLYFCCCIEREDNELLTLEIIHRYVELLDKYFGNVRIAGLHCAVAYLYRRLLMLSSRAVNA